MRPKFLVCVPFTGLGLFGGFRGNHWLKNRIKVFEQFVVPSLLAQTDQEFILWVCWRREERENPQVLELHERLLQKFDKVVFTYTGIPFWDDKYDDERARERLFETLHKGLPELIDVLSGPEEVHWLLQPSDDLYHKETVRSVKEAFKDEALQAVTYKQGYLMNYRTKELLEYNPKTNPPFFAIKFVKSIFLDPGKHMTYIGPYKSHEYIGEKLVLGTFEGRGFVVGTHGENISTHFDHPFGGDGVPDSVLADFGVADVAPINLPTSWRKRLMSKLPHRVRRKLRYWFGELLYSRFYDFIYN